MKKQIKKIFIVVFVISATFLESCDTLESINIFSKEDDVELGRQLDLEIRSNPAEYPIFNGDPSIKRYIGTRIFNHIFESPKVENREIFNYQIELIDRPDVLNAFAIPGGYIYLYTGLLLYLDSEAALAGVIAHEIAHVEERHATQRLTKYYGVSILLGIVLGENPSTLAEIAANLFVGYNLCASVCQNSRLACSRRCCNDDIAIMLADCLSLTICPLDTAHDIFSKTSFLFKLSRIL